MRQSIYAPMSVTELSHSRYLSFVLQGDDSPRCLILL